MRKVQHYPVDVIVKLFRIIEKQNTLYYFDFLSSLKNVAADDVLQ